MSRRPARPVSSGRDYRATAAVRRRRPHREESSGRLQLLGLLVILAAAALLVLHALTHATATGNAQRTLRAVLPALTDLDQAIAAHGDEIAALGAGGEAVAIAGVPLDITIPAAPAAGGSAAVRSAAVDAMVAVVRAHGAAAFRASDAQPGQPGLFSRRWTIERTLNLLTTDSAERFQRLRSYAVVPALLLAVLLGWASGLRQAPLALGSATAISGLLAIVIALVGRAGAWMVGSGSGGVTAASVERVARDLSMTIIAVAAAAAVGGVLLALAGNLAGRLMPEDDGWGWSSGRGAAPRQWEER